MDKNTETKNNISSVLIGEHAYAIKNYDNQDVLKLLEENPISDIKTEIKMEYIEIKQEETDSLEPEYFRETEYHDNMDTLVNMPFNTSVQSVENEECIPFNAESVPKEVYTELQETYKNNLEQLSNSNAMIESLAKENKTLKLQISKLKKQQREIETSITEKSKVFYNDLQKMNEKHTELQNEIKVLRDENIKYKKRLYDCISPEMSRALKENVNEMKKRALDFVNLEKQAITNIKILKDEMDEKERENQAAKLKLASTMKLLTVFQRKFAKRNVVYSMKSNMVGELQNNIKLIVENHRSKSSGFTREIGNLLLALKKANESKARKYTDVNRLQLALSQARELTTQKDVEILDLKKTLSGSESSCKNLEVTVACRDVEIANLKKKINNAKDSIINKDQNLMILKADLERLKSYLFEKDARHKVLNDKYNNLVETFGKKVKENNQEIIKSRQKLIDCKSSMSQKNVEINLLKSDIKELKEEIEKCKTKSCDYCGL